MSLHHHVLLPTLFMYCGPGARPTNDVSIEFKIQWNFVMVLFITYSADHNEILHTSRQIHCRDVCKIPLWLAEYILNQSTAYFGLISNSIEISLVGRAPVMQKAFPCHKVIMCCYLLSILCTHHPSVLWSDARSVTREGITQGSCSPPCILTCYTHIYYR